MSTVRDLGDGLLATFQHDALELTLPGGRSSVSLRAVPPLVQVRLRYGSSRIGVDVSFQPGTVVRELDLTAREHAADPNRWRLAVLSAVREFAPSLQWVEQHPDGLLVALGALAHPLVVPVYQRGHAPSTELPRWSLPILRTTDPTAAARVLAGPDATRRVAKALAASLITRPAPAPVELGPLAIACMGSGLVTADELANILEAPVPPQPAALPTSEQVRDVRQSLELYPAARRAALLLDAARHADGVVLATLAQQLWWIRDRVEHPLPITVDALRNLCRRLVPVIAPGARAVAGASTGASTRASTGASTRAGASLLPSDLHRRVSQEHEAPNVPARTANLLRTVRSWPVQPELLEVNGLRRLGLQFVVPTTTHELEQWGLQLSNCLDGYGPAVVAGRAWLIGIERDQQLIGCVEVQPSDRQIRQALGPRNRPLASGVLDQVISTLDELGITRRGLHPSGAESTARRQRSS